MCPVSFAGEARGCDFASGQQGLDPAARRRCNALVEVVPVTRAVPWYAAGRAVSHAGLRWATLCCPARATVRCFLFSAGRRRFTSRCGSCHLPIRRGHRALCFGAVHGGSRPRAPSSPKQAPQGLVLTTSRRKWLRGNRRLSGVGLDPRMDAPDRVRLKP